MIKNIYFGVLQAQVAHHHQSHLQKSGSPPNQQGGQLFATGRTRRFFAGPAIAQDFFLSRANSAKLPRNSKTQTHKT